MYGFILQPSYMSWNVHCELHLSHSYGTCAQLHHIFSECLSHFHVVDFEMLYHSQRLLHSTKHYIHEHHYITCR